VSDYVLFELVQGETLLQEFRLLDNDRTPIDVTGAAKIVKAASPLAATDFEFTGSLEPGSFVLRADGTATLNWPPGIHEVQLWLDWGAFAILQDERIMDIKISVIGALT
jgi:hypothetical protein